MASFLRKVKSTITASTHSDTHSDANEGQAKTRIRVHAQAKAKTPHAQATPAPSLFLSNHNTTTSTPDLSPRPSTRRLQKPHSGIVTAIPRPPSTELLYNPPTRTRVTNSDHPHPLSQFRRRLVHKASTFSLRGKRWTHDRDQTSASTFSAQEAAKEEERIKESTLFDREEATAVEGTYQRLHSIPSATVAATIAQDQAIIDQRLRERDWERKQTTREALHKHQRNSTNTSSISTIRPATTTATSQTEDEAGKARQEESPQGRLSGAHRDNTSIGEGKPSIKVMASELSAPPVPYTRLKEITESACETALSGVTSYSHADTESWNTTIINNILGALVTETTQQSTSTGSAPAQPQFKYVVNSTIIQHAGSTAPATPGEEPSKKTSGRRGMHAASGAYWNNEKDGMWSFKYPGADSKGLDVVVGVIWVWVG